MAVKKVQHGKGSSYEMTAVVDGGKVVRRRYPTRKQALDEYARLRAAVSDGTFIAADRARISFADYAGLWLGGLQIRASTLAQYRSNLHRHLLPAFGVCRLDRIDRRQVLGFVRTLSDGGLAPATVRGIVNLLRTILRSAVDDGRLVKSPCVRITLPELGPKQLAVFTDSQVAALIAAVHDRHRALLLLALGTGLRQGELLGVTTDAIDLDAGTLRVDKQLLTPAGPGAPYLTPLLKTKPAAGCCRCPSSPSTRCGSTCRPTARGRTGCCFPTPGVAAGAAAA